MRCLKIRRIHGDIFPKCVVPRAHVLLFVQRVLSLFVIGNLGCVPAVFMSKHVVDVFVDNVVGSEDVVILIILGCAMHLIGVTRCLVPVVLQ